VTRVEPESEFQKQRRATGYRQQVRSSGPVTGPPTSAQLRALRHLEHIARNQEPQAPSPLKGINGLSEAPEGPVARVEPESDFQKERRATGYWQQVPSDDLVTGPPTSAQLMALRHLEYVALNQEPQAPPPLKGAEALIDVLRKNFGRLCLFAFNGLSVFIVGIVIQVALIHYAKLSHVQSYIVQTVASVQLSFLLSRYFTWRDRATPFLGALGRFNLQQLTATGLGMVVYAGLEQFKMNYLTANIVVTAFLTPVSFLVSHKWSMTERESSVTLKTLPWPLFLVLTVQMILSLRLIWSNTAYVDEALYLYAGSQELNHWIHGVPVTDYQDYFSGSPAVYPPLGAIASAVGGLTGARLLSLGFMLGTTSLLYLTAKRFFGVPAAFLSTAVFAGLGVTQALSVLATYDPMALFLLALAAYLAIGREHTYNTLTDVSLSTVLAATALAMANACKYATALWDPVIIGLALCAPPVTGYTWRYGRERALRFAIVLGALLAAGIAVGKAKYIQGIMYTTLERSSSNQGMGQAGSLVLRDTWQWGGPILVITVAGTLLLLMDRRRTPFVVLGLLLLAAAMAAPLSQARIGTTVSLQKHVVFGAWFGCIVVGYALSRLMRSRWLSGTAAVIILFGVSALYINQAYSLFQAWVPGNPAFFAGLKNYVKPGPGRYLIEGYADIPEYYVGPSVTAAQWKQTAAYEYQAPQAGEGLSGPAALTAAVQNKQFAAIILNFTPTTGAAVTNSAEIANDNAVVAAILKFGGYRVVGKLPPSLTGSNAPYTVWERVGT
jgi:putative flippase GtrA/4-amino-4-deoxy-L-arabinose transferase-like glycosyltransferase